MSATSKSTGEDESYLKVMEAPGGDPEFAFDPNIPGSAPHQRELDDNNQPTGDHIRLDADTTRGRVLVRPVSGKQAETAQALLDAAESLGLDAGVVVWAPDENGFTVPEDVAEAASIPEDEATESDESESNENEDESNATKRSRAANAKAEAGAHESSDDTSK